VLSDRYVDGVLVGMRPQFVELNEEISDDVASRIDLAAQHDRYVRFGTAGNLNPKRPFARIPHCAYS
jgi:hypothetical protein